jgi:putative tricarboxylic transport membrane protein
LIGVELETLNNLLYGFAVCLQPSNLFFCFLGVLFGTLVGVLPGLGPSAAIALLLPITFYVKPESSIIMLAGIYYGAMYGGSTTSILVNIPGEAASVVTCLDGYAMARQGRAGPALGISAFGSFIAGTLGLVGLVLVAPPLTKLALRFGPPEFFSLMLMSFVALGYLSSGSMIKALMMAAVGLILGSVGMDFITGKMRFTYGIICLQDGIGLVPLGVGIFGISEILLNLETSISRTIYETRLRGLLPNKRDWMTSLGPILRGTLIGFFFGIIPGGGHVTSTFVSYGVEKRISKHPQEFGKGAIEGVAGPESANNAAACGSFVPMLTLGIPQSSVTALLLSSLIIHGVQPGPLLMKQAPEIFWGTIASMYIGNGMLLALNLPLIGIWVKLLKIPYSILFPLILLFCVIGAYSINYTVNDIIIMNIFGILGYLLRKYRFEVAPLALAFVIGPIFEKAMRHSLMLSHGDFAIFVTRPISLGFLIVVLLLLITGLFKKRAPAQTRD